MDLRGPTTPCMDSKKFREGWKRSDAEQVHEPDDESWGSMAPTTWTISAWSAWRRNGIKTKAPSWTVHLVGLSQCDSSDASPLVGTVDGATSNDLELTSLSYSANGSHVCEHFSDGDHCGGSHVLPVNRTEEPMREYGDTVTSKLDFLGLRLMIGLKIMIKPTKLNDWNLNPCHPCMVYLPPFGWFWW